MKTNTQKSDLISFYDHSEVRAYLQAQVDEMPSISDEHEFTRYLKKFAKSGNAYGQSLLGLCLQVGFGCDANPKEAMNWWKKAAKQGDDCSQFYVGRDYYYGQESHVNYKPLVYS